MRVVIGFALMFLSLNSTAQQSVEYKLTFFGDWVASDSVSYPSSAHFTQLIGATHNPGSAVWKRGQLASIGVEDVAELGSTFAIKSELTGAAQAGTTGPTIILESLFNLPSSTSETIVVNIDKPNISLLSMLAPSSDWFVGVSDLSLLKNGRWRQSFTVDLHPYDAGTEDGESFSLSNPETSPPQPINLIGNSPFLLTKPVVARLRFELLTERDPIVEQAPDPESVNRIASVINFLLSE